MVKVAIVGFGLAGEVFHAPFVKAVGMEVSVIMTSNEERANKALSEYPNALIVAELSDILNNKEIDLVVVATPNQSHYPVALAALKAQKHVVIDKPFVIDLKEGEDLIAVAKKEGKCLTVFQNRRFDSDYLTIKKLIAQNRFGEIKVFETYMDRWKPLANSNAWREKAEEGAGWLYDLGAHMFDQVLQLFGAPISLISQVTTLRKDVQSDDCFDVTLFYDNFLVRIGAQSFGLISRPRYLINGTDAAFVKYGTDVQEGALKSGERPIDDTWGEEPADIWGEFINKEGNSAIIPSEYGDYRLIYNNIKNVIENNEALFVTAEQSLAVIRLIELAKQSSEMGKRVFLK